MPVDSLAFASVFFNSFTLLAGGACCGYLGMKTFFQKRHALYLFWGYFLLKMTTVALFDALGWFSIGGESITQVSQVVVSLFNIAVYPVLYYSWNDSFPNIGIVAVSVDVFCAFPMALGMGLANCLNGAGFVVSYIGCFSALSLLRPIVTIAGFFVLLTFAKPVGWRLMQFTNKHETGMTIVILMLTCFIVLFQVPTMDRSVEGILAYELIPMPLLAVLVVSFAVIKGRAIRKRRAYLVRSKALMATCADAMRSQAVFLEESRTMLDGLAERIGHFEASAAREDLGRYLDGLRSTCDALRFGTYSDSPTLDVVLIGYEEKFHELGVRTSYRISPLASTGEEPALAAQALLEWAFRACAGRSGVTPPGSCERGLETVRFRAFRRANQILLEIQVPLHADMRYRYRFRADGLPAHCTIIRAGREGNALAMRLLVGEVVG